MKPDFNEIDEGTNYIGYREALDIVNANVRLVEEEVLNLNLCANRVAAADLAARVSYPSVDVSLKDGFAVKSIDVVNACRQKPVSLKLIGYAYAGSGYGRQVKSGDAVKVCSGAPIPQGADAVVSGEFCEEGSSGEIYVRADAGEGRNIMRAGIEVEAKTTIAGKGERLWPGRLGLMAAAGISEVKVYRRPRVAVISIGDEVVAPGEKLHVGQLYASNLVTMEAWLTSLGISCVTSVLADDKNSIIRELQKRVPDVDAILTSGGAWGSERDLIIGILDELRWQKLFHYVRMGPGKGVAFGVWENVPVFCLPGGPLSNQMAFLQLALPAILRMSGDNRHPLPTVPARLSEDVKGRHRAWTEFKDAVVILDNGGYRVSLYRNKSRLQAIAGAGGLVCIPEGKDSLRCGDVIPVQMLIPSYSY